MQSVAGNGSVEGGGITPRVSAEIVQSSVAGKRSVERVYILCRPDL